MLSDGPRDVPVIPFSSFPTRDGQRDRPDAPLRVEPAAAVLAKLTCQPSAGVITAIMPYAWNISEARSRVRGLHRIIFIASDENIILHLISM